MALDLRQCDQACLGCIKGYKKKHQLVQGEKFTIKCSGIPKDYINTTLLASLPEEEIKTARSLVDPVTWAIQNLDWHCEDPDGSVWKRKNPKEYANWLEANPGGDILGKSRYHRPYQKTMLQCSSRRKIFRLGRQLGKTETLVISILFNMFTAPGKPEKEGYKVIVITPFQAQIELIFSRIEELLRGNPVLANSIQRSVKAPNYSIKLHNGSTIRGFSCIAGTKIVTKRGLVNIEDLKLIDSVLSKNKQDKLEYLPVTEIFVPNFKNVYKVILNSGHEVTVSDDHPFWVKDRQWKKLKELNIGDKVATATDFKFDNSCKSVDDLSYIIGLLLGDGTITEKTFKVGGPRFLSKNPLIQKSFEDTLKRLDLFYRVSLDKRTNSLQYTIAKTIRTNFDSSRPQDRPLNELTLALFNLGLVGKTSLDKFIPMKLLNSNAAIRKGLLKGLFETDGYIQADGLAGFCSISKELAYGVRDLLNTFGIRSSVRLKKQTGKTALINTEQRQITSKHDLYVVTLQPKEATRLSQLVDLSNKGPIYNKFIEKNKNVIETNKEDLYFSKIKAIEYKGQDTTYDIAVGDGTNNFIANGILLHNTAGTKSGGNADSVRGQAADMLVFDEADYLAAGDMDSAIAIITNSPNAAVWMSSTPSGKRERFFRTCHDRDYKEFYYPSMANPLWSEELERTFKTQLTDLGYKHEVLAEWGDQEEGVFQNNYIQLAKSKFTYGSLPYYPNWIYTIGVDWNDTKVGTTIAVTGYNPTTNHFFIVDKAIVSKEGWTQLAACQKVVDLNRVWLPAAIYVDRGFGGTQFEVLKKYGHDSAIDPKKGPKHPDAKIKDILHQYDFGTKVEIRDLFTKMPVEKASKPFLVENTVRRFESKMISFPENDTAFEAQLAGYIIDRITPTGTPVYLASNEQAGDHFLDAVMLSLVAFTLEKTNFGKPVYSSNIGFTGNIGERTQAEIFPGDTVVKDERKQPTRPDTKPSMDRTAILTNQTMLMKDPHPASNTTRDQKVGIWAWDGFLRDEPPPTRDKSSRRFAVNKGARPKRKNL